MMRLLGAAIALAVVTMAGPLYSKAQLLDWADLNGWAGDDHAAALAVFLETCGDLQGGDWPAICALATKSGDARSFFETVFRPVLITDDEEPLFTGYYEPELSGSRSKTDRFRYPLHKRPDEAGGGSPWLSRQEIETTGALEGRDLEIVWLEDPVDKFFLQI